MRPDWIEQWHPTKNTLSPEEVSPGSDKDIWWFNKECGHEWKQSPWSKSVNKGGCQVCINKVVSPGFNDLATTHPEIAKQCIPDSPIQPHEVTYGSQKKMKWECDNGHTWMAIVSDRSRGFGCPGCSNIVSSAEKDITEIIRSYDIDTITSNRKIIRPYELDIYIPKKKIAIEFNGIYWHSEKMGKDRHYHLRKWEMCHEKGIQLITIWEDDWKTKKDIIVSMLLHKLGVSDNDRIPARKTEVVPLDIETTRSFLDNHHIQGYTSGSVYLGLVPRGYPENRPVAVSVWKKKGSSLYLERYATSHIVPGGMGKLLKAGTLWGADNECIDIVTFADREVSDGGLYEGLGFRIDKILEPDYTYLVNNDRKHKFGYRLKRFKNDPELKYQEGLTEKELADLNDLYRIWDQGKVRYVKKIK